MNPHVIALVLLLFVVAPVMAADLTATQISSTEMQVDGTGFNLGTVTLLTETNISVTPSGDDYSYKITGLTLPAGAVLELDASPVNDDLELYLKKNWIMVWTFDKRDGSTIGYSYDSSTRTVHVERSIPYELLGITIHELGFQTIRISGTTAHPSVDLNVAVKQDVTADGSGSFSELVEISAIPAGDYMINANDGANTVTVQTAISAPGDLHSIAITDPETGNLARDTNGIYTFGATGYDCMGAVVQGVAFIWTSSNTSVGTISSSTGDFEADNAGTTEVCARSGTKDSNPVMVSVNAPTVAPTATPTASPTVTPPPVWVKVTPTPIQSATPTVTPTEEVAPIPTKTAVAEDVSSVVAEEMPTKKESTPGFTAVFAIAGLLAIAYVLVRRRG